MRIYMYICIVNKYHTNMKYTVYQSINVGNNIIVIKSNKVFNTFDSAVKYIYKTCRNLSPNSYIKKIDK